MNDIRAYYKVLREINIRRSKRIQAMDELMNIVPPEQEVNEEKTAENNDTI
jgi:hypothetical protein